MPWLLCCFCLLAESYETITIDHCIGFHESPLFVSYISIKHSQYSRILYLPNSEYFRNPRISFMIVVVHFNDELTKQDIFQKISVTWWNSNSEVSVKTFWIASDLIVRPQLDIFSSLCRLKLILTWLHRKCSCKVFSEIQATVLKATLIGSRWLEQFSNWVAKSEENQDPSSQTTRSGLQSLKQWNILMLVRKACRKVDLQAREKRSELSYKNYATFFKSSGMVDVFLQRTRHVALQHALGH